MSENDQSNDRQDPAEANRLDVAVETEAQPEAPVETEVQPAEPEVATDVSTVLGKDYTVTPEAGHRRV